MGQRVRLALGGIAIGIAGGLALGRVLWSLFYQVKASDPLTFAGGRRGRGDGGGADLLHSSAPGYRGRSDDGDAGGVA